MYMRKTMNDSAATAMATTRPDFQTTKQTPQLHSSVVEVWRNHFEKATSFADRRSARAGINSGSPHQADISSARHAEPDTYLCRS